MEMRRIVILIIALGLACIAASMAHADLNDGLVVYYMFEGNANDSSGNNNHGTELNGVTYTNGVSGQSASFDGADDYIDMGVQLGGFSALSVFAWVKGNALHAGNNFIQAAGWYVSDTIGSDGGFQLAITNGFIRSWLIEDKLTYSLIVGPSIQLDKWYLIGYTWDGSMHRLYLDGVEVGSNPYTGTIGTSSKNALVASKYRGSGFEGFFGGEIDELRIYNRALSTSEIQSLYNGLMLHYRFEGNADDSSGNNYHGTEFGGLSYVQGVIGQAASFDGIDDYIDVGAALGSYTGLSVFAWVKVDSISPSYQSIIQACWYRGAVLKNDGGFVFRTNNQSPWSFRSWIIDNFDIGLAVNHLEPIQTGIWTAVGYTWDGETIKTYVNGTETNSGLYDGILGISSKTTLIGGGRDDAGNPLDELFPGDIDDLRVYNRALTDQEILSLYETVIHKPPQPATPWIPLLLLDD